MVQAQWAKVRRTLTQCGVRPGDRVLEIGCGWGAFALVAAQEYGCRVTGLTISSAQAALARERVCAAGLDGRIEILEQDYRLHSGSYTKVASIEMLEAIGEKQFGTYFAAIDRITDRQVRATNLGGVS
jgi:cyclopropane-fatty-acyl-phospholipid synthase